MILISTVRSSKDLVKFDLHHTLGFVANPRRFNGNDCKKRRFDSN